MLYPQSNVYRQMFDLSGFWDFRIAPDNVGHEQNWTSGFDNSVPIAVPASWNEQITDLRDYLGTGWYQTRFDRPWGWSGQRCYVRLNSVNYLAEVWLNGKKLGDHEGGHLPFVFDITNHIQETDNLLVVRVNGELDPNNVPPGNLAGLPGVNFGKIHLPDVNFDFFPYCGIQRPVLLYTTPHNAIEDITVVTEINGTHGIVKVKIECTLDESLVAHVTLQGHGAEVSIRQSINQNDAELELVVPHAALWSPEAPNLYDLTVNLLNDGVIADQYILQIGIRTIAVDGERLLLNDKPVNLLGFGRHEDFPVVGKGMLPALIIKDYDIMHWIGANSFRTSHYPYSEQMMQIADRMGFLIIDETPAVGLFFNKEAGLEKRNLLCMQYIRELIARDKNHPSVIMWSIANEPHSCTAESQKQYYVNNGFDVPESSSHPEAVAAFREQTELVRSLDPTRPVTLVSNQGALEESFVFLDVVCLNRYNGWYTEPGQIDTGVDILSREIDAIYERFPKPLILSEFGVDTIPGHHAQPPEMFSEEYQVEFLTKYIEMLNSKTFVVGQHIWNLCDFKTGQGVQRVGALNYKGVFTRERRPKMAAHRVRNLWKRTSS